MLIQHLLLSDEDIYSVAALQVDEPNDVPLRRPQQVRNSTISSDYVTYFSEDMNELMFG